MYSIDSIEKSLTKREMEVFERIVAKGLRNKEIAKELGISEPVVRGHVTSILKKTGIDSSKELMSRYGWMFVDETIIPEIPPVVPEPTGEKLRKAADGLEGLPEIIPLRLLPGEPFKIGRYSVKAGKQVQDYEFPRKTEAVSRSHASIERTNYGYVLKDLGSTDGTYVNGKKIIQGEQELIRPGDCIEFGSFGAKYTFVGC